MVNSTKNFGFGLDGFQGGGDLASLHRPLLQWGECPK